MTATMNPGVLPETWDVTCPQHDLARRGLNQYHAQNVVRAHNREDHAEGYYVGRVAALVLAAAEDRRDALGDAVADPDKAWVLRKADARMTEILTMWMTLTGIPANETSRALDEAHAAVQQDLVAHVAPF